MPNPAAPPFTVAPQLLDAHPALAGYAARLRALQARSGAGEAWMAGPGRFGCDGGALAAALLAAELGIPVRLCVGLYRHDDPGGGRGWDEHHHWVVLWPEAGEPVLLDPNGPARGEPYAQPAGPAAGPREVWGSGRGGYRYRELPAHVEDRALAYDPDDDWVEVAAEVYPGLCAALAGADDGA